MINMRKTQIPLEIRNAESYLYKIIHRGKNQQHDLGVRGRYCIFPEGQIAELHDYETANERRKLAMRKRGTWIQPLCCPLYLRKLFQLSFPDVMRDADTQLPPPTTTLWFMARACEHYDKQIKQGITQFEPFCLER